MARLKKSFPQASVALSEPPGCERDFGWVFVVISPPRNADAEAPAIPAMVIVNKFSEQVLASSIDYNLEQFVRRYQELIKANQAGHGLCNGPMRFPWPWRRKPEKSVAELAKEAGFYELRGREDAR